MAKITAWNKILCCRSTAEDVKKGQKLQTGKNIALLITTEGVKKWQNYSLGKKYYFDDLQLRI